MYDSDMEVYVGAGKPEVERTIATMKARELGKGAGSAARPDPHPRNRSPKFIFRRRAPSTTRPEAC